MSVANRNTVWATVLADELVKSGLSAVCLAPGSRSTPLVMAFAAQKDLEIYTHFDERCAAFFALGLAKATNKPVALLCTSGTAAVNFYPAIVEAHESAVPLLVLTADRPHELRNSGANQSINQVNLYGSFALWSVDMALPEQNPSADLMRSLRTTIARAYPLANGTRKGVVHLNLPFRKPLEPTPISSDQTNYADIAESRLGSFTQIPKTLPLLDETSLQNLSSVLVNCEHGLIICGVDCPRTNDFAEAVEKLAATTGFPILADVASGLRLNQKLELASAYDSYLASDELDLPKPDIIIRFGKLPTSVVLARYLTKQNPKHDWQINAAGMWADDSHHLSQFIQADEADTCNKLAEKLEQQNFKANHQLKDSIENLERETASFWQDELRNAYFDGAIIHSFLQNLPNKSTVFIGNSLSIRHADQFAQHEARGLNIYANRGASGIDGNISTALGLGAAQPEQALFMILGDLSFYHDMNGLLPIARSNIPITILLINNEGGGIFHRLPISEFEPEFSNYFLTPHKLDFSHAAKLYDLEHHNVTTLDDFKVALEEISRADTQKTSRLIEIHTNSHEDHKHRKQVMQKYQQQIIKTLKKAKEQQ